jgi:diguanylate cyclase (GGDEF)-like protein
MRTGSLQKTSEHHRILVVDDDLERLAGTMLLLRGEGHDVNGASEAAAALELVRSWRPHLVLLDHHLRETTGATVAKEIRDIDDVCQVLLLTGHASEQPARKLLADLHIHGYHAEADGPHRLMVLVDSALEHYRALRSVDRERRSLRRLLVASQKVSAFQSVDQLLQTALVELAGLVGGGDGFVATANSGLFLLGSAAEAVSVHAATGRFAGARAMSELPAAVRPLVRAALTRLEPHGVDGRYLVVPLRTRDGDPGCMIVEGSELPEDAVEACQLYARLVTQALENVRLYEHATVDPLTRLYTRAFGLQRLDEALRLGVRTKTPTSVVLCDVDHFTSVNDRHGHAGGDVVLHALGAALRSLCRASDVASRHGGEELLVVLPATSVSGARAAAERMRRLLEEQRIPFEGSTLSITASFGVATLGVAASARAGSDVALVRGAERALYRAKRGGRNQVVVEQMEDLDAEAA